MKPKRIQLRRAKGWRMPENTVKVDRSTPWGNPFIVGEHGKRGDCIRWHHLLLGGYVCVTSQEHMREQEKYLQFVKEHIGELRGKNLACWCKEGDSCHADVLIEAANAVAKQ